VLAWKVRCQGAGTVDTVVVQRYELTYYLRGKHEAIYTTIGQVDWKST
jgi:hypothetical protein